MRFNIYVGLGDESSYLIFGYVLQKLITIIIILRDILKKK